MKRTKPNKRKPEKFEVKGCNEPAEVVLGGDWVCQKHGNRDYEKRN